MGVDSTRSHRVRRHFDMDAKAKALFRQRAAQRAAVNKSSGAARPAKTQKISETASAPGGGARGVMAPPPPRAPSPANPGNAPAPLPAGFFDGDKPVASAGTKRPREEETNRPTASSSEGANVLAMVMGDDDDDGDADDADVDAAANASGVPPIDAADGPPGQAFAMPPPKPASADGKDLMSLLHPSVLKGPGFFQEAASKSEEKKESNVKDTHRTAEDEEMDLMLKGSDLPAGFFEDAAKSRKEKAKESKEKQRTEDEEMAAFEAEIADDVDTAQEKEHEEEERRAYERVLEVVEAQRVMDQHLDEIKNKMREAKERRDAAAAQAKTVVSQKEEDMSDIDSDEEAAFEDFSNDWRARG